MLATLLLGQIVEEPLETPAPDAASLAFVLQENIKSQVQGNNTFSMDLYNRLRGTKGNLVVSPFNVTGTMAMAYAGASGVTQSQIQSVMHYLSQNVNLYEVFAFLNKKLTAPYYQGPNETRLFIANSVWLQRDLKLSPTYVDIVNKYFQAGLKQVDFMRNPEAARTNINNWVRERTQGRIPNLVAQGDLDASSRMVLVSALFMKAVWKQAFDPSLTKTGVFFKDAIHSVSCQMMTGTAEFPYAELNNLQAIELPYRSSFKDEPEFSMIILLPIGTYDVTPVESILSATNLDTILNNLQPKQVICTIPKFAFSSAFRLDPIFQQMGMSVPFSSYADFSGITGTKDLALGSILHKTYISVDEKGTEAIAATAVSINLTSAQPTETATIFKADHPFIFVIVDRSTRSIIFVGRVETPS